jgi:hypothetical protein
VLPSRSCVVALIWTVHWCSEQFFLHPCTTYWQLKFCVQILLDGLCKWTNYQVRFQPGQPDNSLVSGVGCLVKWAPQVKNFSFLIEDWDGVSLQSAVHLFFPHAVQCPKKLLPHDTRLLHRP